jgi:hypothetical protein
MTRFQLNTTQVRPRTECGGDFAPALGGGSGANRFACEPEYQYSDRQPQSCRRAHLRPRAALCSNEATYD